MTSFDDLGARHEPLIKGLVIAKLEFVIVWLFSPCSPSPVVPQKTLDRCDSAKLAASVETLELERDGMIAAHLASRPDAIEFEHAIAGGQGQLLLGLRDAIDDACRVPPLYLRQRLAYTSAIHSTFDPEPLADRRSYRPGLLSGFQVGREFSRRCGSDAYSRILDGDDRVAKARDLCGYELHFFTVELLIEAYLLDMGIDPELAERALKIDHIDVDESELPKSPYELPGDF